MYLPAHFQSQAQAHAVELIRDYPLASLICNDDEGFPFVSHLPVYLQTIENGAAGAASFRLSGHLARANPQIQFLRARSHALVTVMGPQAFMPTSVYPDAQRVPTWSYLAVHLKVHVRFVDDAQAKDALLKKLISAHDAPYAAQWRGLDATYQQRMLQAIDAFELDVLSCQCKIKINQHRPESHAAMHALYANGNDQERALAEWMVKLGMVQP